MRLDYRGLTIRVANTMSRAMQRALPDSVNRSMSVTSDEDGLGVTVTVHCRLQPGVALPEPRQYAMGDETVALTAGAISLLERLAAMTAGSNPATAPQSACDPNADTTEFTTDPGPAAPTDDTGTTTEEAVKVNFREFL